MSISPIRQIIQHVANSTGFTMTDLIGLSRQRPLSHARQRAMFEAHTAGHLYTAIARVMKRHHSTILYGVSAEAKRRAAQ